MYVCSPGAFVGLPRTLSSALHEMKWQMHILCLGISALDFCLDISFCKKQCATQQVEQIYMSANACHSKGITFIVRKKTTTTRTNNRQILNSLTPPTPQLKLCNQAYTNVSYFLWISQWYHILYICTFPFNWMFFVVNKVTMTYLALRLIFLNY